MVEVGVRNLRFRRHLAACVLVVLLNELSGDLLTGTPTTSSRDEQPQGPRGGAWPRVTRVKLASALEVGPPGEAASTNLEAIYQYDTRDDVNLIERLFARFQAALPVVDLNYSLTARDRKFEFGKLDADIDDYYSERFPANMSLEELQLMSVKAALRTAPIPLHTSWGYETRELLRLGSLPVRDDDLCARQLGHLAARLEQALKAGQASAQAEQQLGGGHSTPVENFESRQIYKTRDLEIMRYLDTFGRVPADLLRGNVRWYGSLSSCMRTRLKPVQAQQQPRGGDDELDSPKQAIKFRYCLGAIKSTGWSLEAANRSHWVDYGVGTTDINLNNYFIRLGLCLPEACDSSALERPENGRALERLMKFNLAKPFNSDHYKLTDLYCLPDARSPLRRIPLAGKLLLVLAAGWLLLVAGATVVHLNVYKFYTKTVDQIERQHRSDEETRTRTARPAEEEHDDDESADRKNEFHESDFMNVKLNWIKLNVALRDWARKLIRGVDLIECLSLYSNWLKYTRRVKLAVVQLHEEEQELERRKRANEQLAGGGGATSTRNGNFGLDARHSNGASAGGAANSKAPMLGELQHKANGELPTSTTSSEAGQHRVDTSSLNALKVIALVWIIAGHCIFYLGSVISNGACLRDYLSSLPAFALSNGAIYITELFFVITGCLTSFLVFKHTTRLTGPNSAGDQLELSDRSRGASSGTLNGESPTQNKEQEAAGREDEQQVRVMERRLMRAPFWFLIALNRYLRILPTYLLVYAFVKLVSLYVGGSGQLWDYAVSPNSMRRACQEESWWPTLSLTTNFNDIYKHCIVGGWYLSADMQFALMSIPLLVVLAFAQRSRSRQAQQQTMGGAGGRRGTETSEEKMSKRAGQLRFDRAPQKAPFVVEANKRIVAAYALIFALALLSGLISIVFTLVQSRVDMSYIIKFSPHTIAILSQNISMYTNPVFRFRAFALGLILGHLLYLYEFKLIKLPKFLQLHGSKVAVLLFWLGFCIMFAPVLYPMGKLRLSHDMTAALTILSAGGIDIFLCTLIFFVCIGKAPKMVLFALNSPFWSLLSALSLSAFLVHTEIIVLLTSLLDPPPSVSYSLLLFVFSATLLLTYSTALGLYLTFEMPVSRLVEGLMRSFVGLGEQMKNSKTWPDEKAARK